MKRLLLTAKILVYHYMARPKLTENHSSGLGIAQATQLGAEALNVAVAEDTVLIPRDLALSGLRLISRTRTGCGVKSAGKRLCIRIRTMLLTAGVWSHLTVAVAEALPLLIRRLYVLDAFSCGERCLSVRRFEIRVIPKHGRSRWSVARKRMRSFTTHVGYKSADGASGWKRNAPEHEAMEGIFPEIVTPTVGRSKRTGKVAETHVAKSHTIPKHISECLYVTPTAAPLVRAAFR